MQQDNTRFSVQNGDVILLSPFHTHMGIEKSCEPVMYYWLHFYSRAKHSEYFDLSDQSSAQPLIESPRNPFMLENIVLPLHVHFHDTDRQSMLFHQISYMAHSKKFPNTAIDYLLTVLLIDISTQWISDQRNLTRSTIHTKRVSEISEWIRIHLNSNIPVQAIAEQFNYNPDYLSRIFKQEVGMSIHQYIVHLKVARAKDYLLNSHMGIKEIAYLSGFNNEKYFLKVFKSHEGTTPTQFRNAFFYTHMNDE